MTDTTESLLPADFLALLPQHTKRPFDSLSKYLSTKLPQGIYYEPPSTPTIPTCHVGLLRGASETVKLLSIQRTNGELHIIRRSVRDALPPDVLRSYEDRIRALFPNSGGGSDYFRIHGVTIAKKGVMDRFIQELDRVIIELTLQGIATMHSTGPHGPRLQPRVAGAPTNAPLAVGEDTALLEDDRLIATQEVTVREGQSAFRQELLRVYGGACAISGCSIVHVLQAAHIVPYRGPHSNTITNGLLLRADIHNLFDRGLIWVDPVSFTVQVASDLQDSEYARFHDIPLQASAERDLRPSPDALARHRARNKNSGGGLTDPVLE